MYEKCQRVLSCFIAQRDCANACNIIRVIVIITIIIIHLAS